MNSLPLIKKQIESLNKTRQIEILKIFLKHNVSVTENNNGSFINITYLSDNCLDEVNKYLKYIEDQDITLNTIETVKEEIENNYFKKTDEEKTQESDSDKEISLNAE
tara:strand:- start:2436 stop:2756 length:321 start_codon:yes stop_codon:yes gene_type:complete